MIKGAVFNKELAWGDDKAEKKRVSNLMANLRKLSFRNWEKDVVLYIYIGRIFIC